MMLYINAGIAKHFNPKRIEELTWDFLCRPMYGTRIMGREVKTIPAFCMPSMQGGLYVLHPSLELMDEEAFLNFLMAHNIEGVGDAASS